jgi:hypothetical protein
MFSGILFWPEEHLLLSLERPLSIDFLVVFLTGQVKKREF